MKVEIGATEKQRLFLEAVLDNKYYEQIGFGGARGGGKTFVSCLAMVLRRLRYTETRGLMLRRVQGSADQNLGEEIGKVVRLLGLPTGMGRRGCVWLDQKKQWYFPNGSYIQLGYCRTPSDWEKYQGVEYADVAFEEATQFLHSAWLNVSGSNRSNNPLCTPKRWATTNPGGIGSAWVEKEFIDEETRSPRTLWIPSLLKESKALLEQDPGYRDRVLAKLPDWRRKQWEDGDWDAVEGQFFQINPSLIREVDVPYWADVYCGVDAGYWPSAYAAVWYAVWKEDDGRQRVHVLGEIKKHKLNLIQQAEESLEMERLLTPKFSRVTARFADPAAWKRTESDGGGSLSTSYTWSQHGFVVSAALTNARAAGWLLLRTLLDGGQITFSPQCRALIKEMEDAVHSEKDDDIAKECEDHALDALRYGLISTVFMAGKKEEKADPYGRKKKKKKRGKNTTVIHGSL